ncbi:hypothetical protein ND2E_2147 [Colwellia psychrerythraea]|uniref:Uncharacterized protein n=2 Tax=Colwellia psychrerythraea TaxID=28229 RepID=A0A099KSD8_COLPS|nr:hypothetical protein ND2E_2147 [Colwellia psychrerythraea]
MHYQKKTCLFVLCVIATFTSYAIENMAEQLIIAKDKVNSAILKFEMTDKTRWSYHLSRYENEEGDITSSIEQYSPQDSEPWLLKQLNGELPTEKQIKQFAEKKQIQHSTQNGVRNSRLKLRKLINQNSLSLVSTGEKYFVLAFDVSIDNLGKEAIGKLQGELTYHKEQQFIEKISIWNNAEFSPMFTANITELAITFSFLEINGAVLIKQNEMKMKGSFAYFTEINETSLDQFSNYVYQIN